MTTNLHGWMPPAVGADMAALSNSDGPVQELANAAASMEDFKGIHKNAPFIGFVFVAPYQNRFCCTRADLPGSLSGDAV